jgi:hypothetical protein
MWISAGFVMRFVDKMARYPQKVGTFLWKKATRRADP